MQILNLILLSEDLNDLEFTRAVCKSSGLNLIHAKSPDQVSGLISDDSKRFVLFIDASDELKHLALEESIQKTVGLFSEKVDPNLVYFIGAKGLGEYPYLIKSPIFGNFIMRNYGDPKKAGVFFGKVIDATIKNHIFNLDKILNKPAQIQSVTLKVSTQKLGVVNAVKNYLLAAKIKERTAICIANAVDEVIMNAIFDAPVDEIGNQLYESVPRDKVLKLEGKDEVEVQLGFDGEYIAISTIDNHGSLSQPKLLKFISKVYSHEKYKLKHSVAGCGIGLARIFQSGGGSLIFSSDVGSRTEVTLLFKAEPVFNKFKNQFRFILTKFYKNS